MNWERSTSLGLYGQAPIAPLVLCSCLSLFINKKTSTPKLFLRCADPQSLRVFISNLAEDEQDGNSNDEESIFASVDG